MFNHVFGVGWGTFFSSGTSALPGTLLGQLAITFNALLLTVLALLVGYHFVVAAGESSHSGIPMGRRYHSFWMPVRSATAFITLAPLPMVKGFCVLQLVVLSASYYGIGLADSLWGHTTDYLSGNGGQISVLLDHSDAALTSSVLKIVTLQNYIARTTPGAQAVEPVIKADPASTVAQQALGIVVDSVAPGTVSMSGGELLDVYFPVKMPTGTSLTRGLGYVQIQCPSAVIANFCQAQAHAVVQMANTLQPLVADILEGSGVYGVNNSPAAPTPIPTTEMGVFGMATADYQQALQQAVELDMPTLNSSLTTKLKGWSTTAKLQGWASAGSWFIQMNTVASQVQSQLDVPPKVIGPSVQWVIERFTNYDFKSINESIGRYLKLYDPTYAAITPAETHIRTTFSSDGIPGAVDSVSSAIDSAYDTVRSWWNNHVTLALVNKVMQTMAGNTFFGDKASDPISELVSFGHSLIDAGYVTILVSHGSGRALMGFGMVLAFFVPAYPYVIWFLAVLGWFILALEVFVAAPLWALTHMEPAGEGFAGTRARQGYMMVFGVLLRPSLMVFAFILTITILKVAFWLFANGMSTFMQALESNYIAGPLTIIALLSIIVFVAAAILYKVAGIPAWLPNHVLDFLGQFVQPLDAHSDTQRVYGAVLKRTPIASTAGNALNRGMNEVGGGMKRLGANGEDAGEPGPGHYSQQQSTDDVVRASQTTGDPGPAGETDTLSSAEPGDGHPGDSPPLGGGSSAGPAEGSASGGSSRSASPSSEASDGGAGSGAGGAAAGGGAAEAAETIVIL